jgi:hypothetical protein
MEFFDHLKYLGMCWGEDGLLQLMTTLENKKTPKISKGDVTAHLEFKKLGVFLVFKDERFVKLPNKTLPEGSIVLTNISFYMNEKDGYKPYQGKLINGMTRNLSQKEAISLLGIPSNKKINSLGEPIAAEEYRVMRWDQKDYTMFCSFSSDGGFSQFSLQLPPDQA